MGVARESARSVVSRTIDELNEINDLLSSDTDHQPPSDEKRTQKKRKSSRRRCGQIYSCRKSNDLFLKELSAELGIDGELQDIAPQHNSPLSSLFEDPDKMKIWLVFMDANEDTQEQMLRPEQEKECRKRCKRISKSLRDELQSVPIKTVKQFEDVIYSTMSDMGCDSVVVLPAKTRQECVVIVAISQYSRLQTTSHLPIRVIEIETKQNKKFVRPKIPLSKVLSI